MTHHSPLSSARRIDSAMSPQAFEMVSKIALREAGLVLSESKINMVKSRLTRRLRALGLTAFEEYLDFADRPENKSELRSLISALTTNVSHFFREAHHFEFLKTTMVPEFKARLARGESVRIWSAGCSNGQEPYSIAMALLETDASFANKDVKILATDIDPEVLVTAKAGIYEGSLASGLEPQQASRFFTTTQSNEGPSYQANSELKSLITFRELNLHGAWPMKAKFNAIFCRNVVIYFDEDAQKALFMRFADQLHMDGWLCIGHSERLSSSAHGFFKNAGVTTHQKIANPSRQALAGSNT